MKHEIKIKNKVTGEVIFSPECGSLKLCVEAAVESGVNLREADLYGADLSGANLSDASLSDANLSGTNLSGANLSDANLFDANLFDADLWRANLWRANLRGARGIIRVGPSCDGYEFFGVVRDGVTWIKAGCRWFTVKDARKHWKETRGGTDLGAERLEFVSFIAKWGRRNGAKK